MFIRIKTKDNGKRSVQIVENIRVGKNINQRIIRHVGQAVTDREVEELKKLGESIIVETKNQKQPVLPLFRPEEFYQYQEKESEEKKSGHFIDIKKIRELQRIVVGVGEVFGKLYKDLGFDSIISETRKDDVWNSILKSCVLARLANPGSKMQTADMLEQDYGIKIDLQKIYRMMDRVYEKEEEVKARICKSTLNLFKERVDVLFFDVTTLYFESVESDELRDFGFSKDCAFKEVQVVLALVATPNGLPITYKLFPGNMYEGHTLIEAVRELKQKFDIQNTVLVADRAMFNNENLRVMDEEKINYVVAARLRSLKKEKKNQILSDDNFRATVVEDELHWYREYEHEGRRLIVGYSANRARKDAKDRTRLIDRLLKKVKNGKIKISDIVPNYGSKKYLKILSGDAVVNEAKISEDARWDGLYGIITKMDNRNATDLMNTYRGLWQIEEAFRVNKHDLKMRPIFHFTPERIRAHIAICFIAYAIAKQATYRMSVQQFPMSFEQLRNELLHVQASLVVDLETDKKHMIPSHVTSNQIKIYQAFGLKRSEVPYAIA